MDRPDLTRLRLPLQWALRVQACAVQWQDSARVCRFSTDSCHFRHKATEISRLTGADAVRVGGGRAVCDIWLVLLVSNTRVLIDNRMTLITAFGRSWLISKFQRVARSFIIMSTLKSQVNLSAEIYITARFHECLRISGMFSVNWVLSSIVNATRNRFCEWVVCVCGLIFPFFVCLVSSLFVPEFNEQKVLDLIASSLVVDSDLCVWTSRWEARGTYWEFCLCISLIWFSFFDTMSYTHRRR